MARTRGPSTDVTLNRVLEGLEDTLLELIQGERKRALNVSNVVIYDKADPPELWSAAVVLGVGLDDPDDVADVLQSLGRHSAAALVVRSGRPVSDKVARAANRSRVVLLGLREGATWSQLFALLHALVLQPRNAKVTAERNETPGGDLFALANAIAALLDAPVTIEDTNFDVLAFSSQQGEADQSRIESILGRRVPKKFTQSYVASGLIERLYETGVPIYIPAEDVAGYEPGALGRSVVAVKAGDEPLGSIWAAVKGDLDRERTQALLDSARVVALHLLRVRATRDFERAFQHDLVLSALAGGPDSSEALAKLGLIGKPLVVVACTVPAPSEASEAASVRSVERVANAFALHLSHFQPLSIVATIGQVAYAVIPVRRTAVDVSQVDDLAKRFLERTSDTLRPAIGIGSLVRSGADLNRSRAAADRALRVLSSSEPGFGVATSAEVQIPALMLEVGDLLLARSEQLMGPVERLREYDTAHKTALLETLVYWLDAFGDVSAAARRALVHVNTFRYRLRRLAEVGSIDLGSPDQRFAAMLQVRLLDQLTASDS